MLIAHLVPGYFALARSQPNWNPEWNKHQQAFLVAVAFGGTVVQDTDVVYNVLFRGFINHSTLWTHSVFIYLGIALCWVALNRIGRWHYLQALLWFIAFGGLAHLVLDVMSHGTPLFYPFSTTLVGIAPSRVVQGGFWAYITDPIFLFEPFLLLLVALHWTLHSRLSLQWRRFAFTALVGAYLVFNIAFLLLLPVMQNAVAGLL